MSNGKFRTWWNSHGSTVLTIINVVSCMATPIISIIETPKALQAIKEAEDRHYEDYIQYADPDSGDSYQPLNRWQKIKIGIRHHIGTITSAVIGVISGIGAHKMDTNTVQNISTAYNLLSLSDSLYRKTVEENVTPDKLNKINAAVAEKEIKMSKPPETLYLETGDDKIAWFKDEFSKRYFRSCTVKLNEVKNNINCTMLNEGFISLNEWYIQLGMDPIDLGWDIGWHATIPGELMNFHIEYSSLDDGTPCGLLVFSPTPMPRKGSFN